MDNDSPHCRCARLGALGQKACVVRGIVKQMENYRRHRNSGDDEKKDGIESYLT